MRRLAMAAILASLALGSAAPAFARGHQLELRAVCQADEDLYVFKARARDTIEISWQHDFSDAGAGVFDTVDLRRHRWTTFYTGEPDTGSVTLFARLVDRHRVRAEVELSERPCKPRDLR